jgi:hypothetical protein
MSVEQFRQYSPKDELVFFTTRNVFYDREKVSCMTSCFQWNSFYFFKLIEQII